MSAPATATQQAAIIKSMLWPSPVPIIGLTGEFASGKTLFALTIDPKNTRVYDEEKSSQSYLSLGFDRVDLFDEMTKKFPNGSTPLQVYEWWLADVRAIKPGRFRVIVLDTIGTIESGLVDWVETHPQHFGKTANQYAKSSALMWGDVKEHWKLVLSDIAAKCETFVFVSHMATVWRGGEPTLKRKPKGKETLMELASLYLLMERKADSKGNAPAKPAAIVLKSRLASFRMGANGEIETTPTLPPRIPECTPHAIRQYMLKPPDYTHLSETEKAPDLDAFSEDDRLQLSTERAKAECETERMRTERDAKRSSVPRERPPTRTNAPGEVVTAPVATAPQPATEPVADKPRSVFSTEATADSAAHKPIKGPSQSQRFRLAELRDMVLAARSITAESHPEESKAAWVEALEPFGVTSAAQLPNSSIPKLIEHLEKKFDAFPPQPQPGTEQTEQAA